MVELKELLVGMQPAGSKNRLEAVLAGKGGQAHPKPQEVVEVDQGDEDRRNGMPGLSDFLDKRASEDPFEDRETMREMMLRQQESIHDEMKRRRDEALFRNGNSYWKNTTTATDTRTLSDILSATNGDTSSITGITADTLSDTEMRAAKAAWKYEPGTVVKVSGDQLSEQANQYYLKSYGMKMYKMEE